MIRDTEEMLLAIQAVLVANINARISAINTEKGDTLLTSIPCATSTEIAEHFYFSLNELPNKDPFVNIALEKSESDPNGDSSASLLTVVVELVFRDQNKITGYVKSLRYARALKEALEHQALELDMQLEELIPMPVDAGGVAIMVSGVRGKFKFA